MLIARIKSLNTDVHSNGETLELGLGDSITPAQLVAGEASSDVEWASADARAWVYQRLEAPPSSPAPPHRSRGAEQAAMYRLGRWLGKNRKLLVAAAALILVAVVVVPLFGVVRDAMNPVAVRADGALPDLKAMIGKSHRDAVRMLGSYTQFPGDELQAVDTDANLGVETEGVNVPWVRFGMYMLPDLEGPTGEGASVIIAIDGDGRVVKTSVTVPQGVLGGLSITNPAFPKNLLASCGLAVGSVGTSEFVRNPIAGVQQVFQSWKGTTSTGSTAIGWEASMSLVDQGGHPVEHGCSVDVYLLRDGAQPSTPSGAVDAPVQPNNPAAQSPSANAPASDPAATTELGGTPQEGERLYFIIGASATSKAAAQKKLDEAMPSFGDMQPYFVVLNSNDFDGLAEGYWIVAEAHRAKPTSEDIDFAKRGFPGAYVKQVTVVTFDPIPVYEDMVDGAQ